MFHFNLRDARKAKKIFVVTNKQPLLGMQDPLMFYDDENGFSLDSDANGNKRYVGTTDNFLQDNLDKIASSGGSGLLEQISNHLSDESGNKMNIYLTHAEDTKHRDGHVYLNISEKGINATVDNGKITSLFRKTPVNVIKSKGYIPTSIQNVRKSIVYLEKQQVSFDKTLLHEFNHLNHQFIDMSNEGGNRSREKYQSDNSRVGGEDVFDNAEEHRNSFSPLDPYSDLNISMKNQLPIRYPYASESEFIEPVKTVIRNAIRSEKPIEGTTLNIASSREWLSKLKGLVDKLDELPKTRVSNSKLGVLHRADTVDTNDSNSMQHTKIKLLPYLFGEDGYPFPTEQKQQILESYTQHMRDKGEKTPWISFFDRFINNKTEKRFNKMMSDIKLEQDSKISQDSEEQQKNGLGKYSFIPRMLAREIKKGNVQVKESTRLRRNNAVRYIDPERSESDLVALFTQQMHEAMR